MSRILGTPDHATGILFGTINNTPFGGSPIIANGTKIEDKKTRIFATIKSVPPSVGKHRFISLSSSARFVSSNQVLT